VKTLEKLLAVTGKGPISILDFPIAKYTPLNLSVSNGKLKHLDLSDPSQCQRYIDIVLGKDGASVAFGGYLEKRALYRNYQNFLREVEPRNIHLGIDFWAKADSRVLTPVDGIVHSFKNNASDGDYGPTIILAHNISGFTFYTLYGHLSLESLRNLFIGKVFRQGELLAKLGATDINVNYAPHLHFQVIMDLGVFKGDYPGVSSTTDLGFYARNCPDPNILLKF
jgi:murein DD-endopeptidase MepM/ murein hydrolase activator NlpD